MPRRLDAGQHRDCLASSAAALGMGPPCPRWPTPAPLRTRTHHCLRRPPGPGPPLAAQVTREAYPDHTQFDPASEYFDAKARRDSPTWVMVDCRLVREPCQLAGRPPLQQLGWCCGAAPPALAAPAGTAAGLARSGCTCSMDGAVRAWVRCHGCAVGVCWCIADKAPHVQAPRAQSRSSWLARGQAPRLARLRPNTRRVPP